MVSSLVHFGTILILDTLVILLLDTFSYNIRVYGVGLSTYYENKMIVFACSFCLINDHVLSVYIYIVEMK